jgi:glucose/arabinose dehydrogenase
MGVLAAVAGLTLLSGCGDDGDSTATAPPAKSGGKAAVPGDGEGGVKLTKLGDFDQPVYVTQPTGESDDLYVVERGGTVRVIHDGKVESKPFLDLGEKVETGYEEQGLLSIAFAPDYAKSGLLYAYYTAKGGDNHVVEFQRSDSDPLTADPGSERNLMTIEHSENSNHNGGLLLFGPDRDLYIGLGDGGAAGDPDRNGQSLETFLGKILRIDPRAQGGKPYGIPQDNPFVGRPGAKPEIFAYGLRNPWRFSFDPSNQALVIGDVGQDRFEEVDYLPRSAQPGANLGWSAFEGPARFNDDQQAPDAVKPVFSYGREDGCSITGGYVVRDRALTSLYGRYLYADYCVGEMHSFTPGKAGDDRPLGETVPGLSSFGVDNAGHVYATSFEGPVYRIDPE